MRAIVNVVPALLLCCTLSACSTKPAVEPGSVEDLVQELDKMIGEGLVTLEKVRVIAYRHNSKI